MEDRIRSGGLLRTLFLGGEDGVVGVGNYGPWLFAFRLPDWVRCICVELGASLIMVLKLLYCTLAILRPFVAYSLSLAPTHFKRAV